MKSIFDLLRDPSVTSVDVDDAERFDAHGELLKRKLMLREVFEQFHHDFDRLDRNYLSGEGLRIELGSGIAPIRDTYSDVLATDVVSHASLDTTLNAEDMNLEDGTVRALFGQNCFHHFPRPEKFFAEALRVLVPGGGIVLLEPYYGLFASFLFKRLFASEGFDKAYPSWETPAIGPMNGANQALSYIVFVRDRPRFETEFPGLQIIHGELCRNHLKYLLSGGVNFRQLAPDWSIPAVNLLQSLTSPLNRWLSLHHITVIKKL